MHGSILASTPTSSILEEGNIKVSESSEFGTLRTNAMNVDSGVLEYVMKQMHREEITGEVIGQAIIFQEEIDEFERELEEAM